MCPNDAKLILRSPRYKPIEGKDMRKLIITSAIMLMVCAVIAARGFTHEARSRQSYFSENFSAAETARGAGTLCNANEDVIFNCEVAGKGKVVSLCGSKQFDRQQGYLQYRFGKSGAIELEYPHERQNTQAAFKYSRYTRALVTLLTVRFETNGYTYELHDDDNSEEHPRRRDFYLSVMPPGANANSTEMRCRQPVTSHLSKLEDVVPNEEAP